ncbi:MAG: oligosaccharide flippase family protein [Vicingaceae bacterium]|nr:oligosaccharide flippase family protein [Vicingaceae bacterium]
MSTNDGIQSLVKGFFKRKGGYILSSIIISKVFSFLLSIFVVKHLTTNDFGNISYSYNIISFIIPFMGFGIFQSLSRFAPIANSQSEKRRIFKFTFWRGVLASIIITIILIALAGIITQNLPNAKHYLIYLSFLVLSLFIMESVKLLYRVYNLNKLYAYIEISHSLLLLVLGVTLTYFLDGVGYVLALLISPLIIALLLTIKNKLYKKTPATKYDRVEKLTFWKYGFFTSIGGLAAKLLFSIDILMIGFLLKDETEVALYKAASLIPFSLLFIPNGFIQTDLIKLTREYQNKAFLKKYILNYLKLFGLISIVTAITLTLLAEPIMQFFGEKYHSAYPLIPVFAIGIIGAFVFRNLFGNLLDAFGWAKTSAILSITILLLDVVLNYFLVKEHGIIGAAYSTSILLWSSGILSAIAILVYLKRLK